MSTRFFVARPVSLQDRNQLVQEQQNFGDIEVVPVDEHYANITHQTLAALRYFSHPAENISAPLFIVKTDDDVRRSALLHTLPSRADLLEL
jgi:hypothetical protein